MSDEILATDSEGQQICEPQRNQLEREVERARLDPAPNAPDPFRPLRLDALLLLAWIQLDLGRRTHLELSTRGLTVAADRHGQCSPWPHLAGLSANHGPREQLRRPPQRAPRLARELQGSIRVAQRQPPARDRH